MEDRLILCAGCGRHVFSGAEQCPFCSRPRATSASSLAAAVVVSGALLAGCSGGQQSSGDVPPEATAVAVYGAPAPSSDERVPEPAPSEAPPPAPTEDAPVTPPAPVYGPPPKQSDNR